MLMIKDRGETSAGLGQTTEESLHTLVLPLPMARRLWRGLAQQPERLGVMWVNQGKTPGQCQWLVREIGFGPVAEADWGRLFIVTTSPSLDMVSERPLAGHLYLGEGTWRGQWRGAVNTENATAPLHRCLLVGAGMHQFVLQENGSPWPSESERWSRTIGALGGGEIWQRLVALSVAVIGCGRTGSLLAVALARLGIRRLTLIDPDRLELHNLGEMDGVGLSDLGLVKAQALAGHLHDRGISSGAVRAIAAPAVSTSALLACKSADVLFCCADNDAARLTAAIIATLYHKVLIDLGTGILLSAQIPTQRPLPFPPRTMGADVRLILPGDGCLLCRGNLANYAQALDDLCNYRALANFQNPWPQQRAGSLRSLNQLAVGVSLQMLQDLVAERLTTSLWAHLEFDDHGRLSVQYPALAGQPAPCPLCAKAGLGDEGLLWGG